MFNLDRGTIIAVVILVIVAGLYIYSQSNKPSQPPTTVQTSTTSEQFTEMPQITPCSSCQRMREQKELASKIDFDEDGKYIINFHTTWCPASRKFKPLWDRFTQHNSHKEFKTIDVVCDDVNNPLYKKFQEMGVVQYFPTVLVYYKRQPFVYDMRSFEDIEIQRINEYVDKIIAA